MAEDNQQTGKPVLTDSTSIHSNIECAMCNRETPMPKFASPTRNVHYSNLVHHRRGKKKLLTQGRRSMFPDEA
ncbi:hypothetical protein RRG08_064149 [Elysia crispata]|uniref:Uncharacterized protein n=1 Tax=Elysia crispata TaxID=231223 RepID=A0AAE0ZN86_9GAST|nr:hypothetical protein RRG08_064149 [Elysia crispata]